MPVGARAELGEFGGVQGGLLSAAVFSTLGALVFAPFESWPVAATLEVWLAGFVPSILGALFAWRGLRAPIAFPKRLVYATLFFSNVALFAYKLRIFLDALP